MDPTIKFILDISQAILLISLVSFITIFFGCIIIFFQKLISCLKHLLEEAT